MMIFFGGAKGIRDYSLLKSALSQPQLFIFYNEKKDLFDVAAVYCFHLIKNHPFVDGNKRTGLLVALIFLKKNGFTTNVEQAPLYDYVIKVAESKVNKEEIAAFFRQVVKNIK